MQPYNNYFQNPYQPVGYPQQFSPMNAGYQAPQAAQSTQPIAPQIQNSGFVFVQNENEARMYPVAPGNSVTFKDENAPFCYVKTMGFSQLERPVFEKYRLVKENDVQEPQNPTINGNSQPQEIPYVLKSDLIELQKIMNSELQTLRAEIDSISISKSTSKAKKDKEADEE